MTMMPSCTRTESRSKDELQHGTDELQMHLHGDDVQKVDDGDGTDD